MPGNQEHQRAALTVHACPAKAVTPTHLVNGFESEQRVEAHQIFNALHVQHLLKVPTAALAVSIHTDACPI